MAHYYVKRENLTTGKTEYKKYKCIDGWTIDKSQCWKFSKQGASQIAKRESDYEERNFAERKYIYGTELVMEAYGLRVFTDKANAQKFVKRMKADGKAAEMAERIYGRKVAEGPNSGWANWEKVIKYEVKYEIN